MRKKVWYTLAQQGSKLSEDAAHYVMLDDDDTVAIADLKEEVWKQNQHTLAKIDARNLGVFEYGKTEDSCKPRTKLNKCTSGSDEKPFSIFYGGTAAEPRFVKHIIHRTLHATCVVRFYGDEYMFCCVCG